MEEQQEVLSKTLEEADRSSLMPESCGIYRVREFFLFQYYIMTRYIVFDVETPNRYNNRISGERAACVLPNLGVEG